MIYLWYSKGVSYAMHEDITIALDDCTMADEVVLDLMAKGTRLAAKDEYQYKVKHTQESWEKLLKLGTVV
jgi:hypothetical protein